MHICEIFEERGNTDKNARAVGLKQKIIDAYNISGE